MPAAAPAVAPSIVVLYGDDDYRKVELLHAVLDDLLPPATDRALALSEFDGTRSEEQGGPALAHVMDDLRTLPFLVERRVVIVRDAERFVTSHRETLEKYARAPSRSATLILSLRSFPSNTRLYKAVAAAGGRLLECKRPSARALTERAAVLAGQRGKRLDAPLAARIVDLVGAEPGVVAGEVEKLCLYVGERTVISDSDVSALVSQTREERIFAACDAAALGRGPQALELWRQVLDLDRDAAYRAVGGVAYVLRRWLAARRALAGGESIRQIAPRVMMWGRERELADILRRLTEPRLRRALAAVAELDAEVKVGGRSIEAGIEHILLDLARP
jgi:DNA polymerase-3 subunit delta